MPQSATISFTVIFERARSVSNFRKDPWIASFVKLAIFDLLQDAFRRSCHTALWDLVYHIRKPRGGLRAAKAALNRQSRFAMV